MDTYLIWHQRVYELIDAQCSEQSLAHSVCVSHSSGTSALSLPCSAHTPAAAPGWRRSSLQKVFSVVVLRSGFKSDRRRVGSRLHHLLITTSSISCLFPRGPHLQNSHGKG